MSETSRPTYKNARAEFLAAAKSAGFSIDSSSIEGRGIDGGDLFQDYAYKLTDSDTTIVHMSGVHGIEGYLGSNIQYEFLKNFSQQSMQKLQTNCIFVHAVNPYGMSWYRRTNGDNVDLNRNGVFTGQNQTQLTNPVYSKFIDLLSCQSRIQLLLTWPKAFLRALSMGFAQVSTHLPAGQYEFPELIFFGGKAQQAELQILTAQLQKLAPQTKRWVFIDVHSGLGKYAQDLLLVADDSAASLEFWGRKFSPDELTVISQQKKIYRGTGLIEDWITAELGKKADHVFYMMQEFGTAPALKVLSNTILENAWFQKNLRPEERCDLMLSTFCPNQRWLEICTLRGLQVLHKTMFAKVDLHL